MGPVRELSPAVSRANTLAFDACALDEMSRGPGLGLCQPGSSVRQAERLLRSPPPGYDSGPGRPWEPDYCREHLERVAALRYALVVRPRERSRFFADILLFSVDDARFLGGATFERTRADAPWDERRAPFLKTVDTLFPGVFGPDDL